MFSAHQFYDSSFRVGGIKSDDVVHKNLRCDRNNVKSNLAKPQERAELGMSAFLYFVYLNQILPSRRR